MLYIESINKIGGEEEGAGWRVEKEGEKYEESVEGLLSTLRVMCLEVDALSSTRALVTGLSYR